MKFQSGVSGNPNGRKPGTGHRQRLFNTLVEPHRDLLFQKALELALAGNEPMLRLFLERMLPVKPKDDELPLSIKTTANDIKTLTQLGNTIIQSVMNGELTSSQGSSVMSIIESQRKNIEVSDLEIRVAEIERVFNHRQKEK